MTAAATETAARPTVTDAVQEAMRIARDMVFASPAKAPDFNADAKQVIEWATVALTAFATIHEKLASVNKTTGSVHASPPSPQGAPLFSQNELEVAHEFIGNVIRADEKQSEQVQMLPWQGTGGIGNILNRMWSLAAAPRVPPSGATTDECPTCTSRTRTIRILMSQPNPPGLNRFVECTDAWHDRAPQGTGAASAYKPEPLRLAFIRGIRTGLPFDLPRDEMVKAAKLAYPDAPVTEPRLVQSGATGGAELSEMPDHVFLSRVVAAIEEGELQGRIGETLLPRLRRLAAAPSSEAPIGEPTLDQLARQMIAAAGGDPEGARAAILNAWHFPLPYLEQVAAARASRSDAPDAVHVSAGRVDDVAGVPTREEMDRIVSDADRLLEAAMEFEADATDHPAWKASRAACSRRFAALDVLYKRLARLQSGITEAIELWAGDETTAAVVALGETINFGPIETHSEHAKLVAFFRSEEGAELGRQGDHDNLSPAETAIRVMRQVIDANKVKVQL